MRRFPGREQPNARQREMHSTQIFRSGVERRGGWGLCCLAFLFGRWACFLCFEAGDSDLTTLEAVSSGPLPPPPASPVAIAEETSSNFVRTAKMERAALNASLGLSVIFGKDIPNC